MEMALQKNLIMNIHDAGIMKAKLNSGIKLVHVVRD